MKRRQFLGSIGIGLLAAPIATKAIVPVCAPKPHVRALVWTEEALQLQEVSHFDWYVGEIQLVPEDGDWRISGPKVWLTKEHESGK